jgi:hypothetical protein
MDIQLDSVTVPSTERVVYYKWKDMKVIIIDVKKLLITLTDWFRCDSVTRILDLFQDTEIKGFFVTNTYYDTRNPVYTESDIKGMFHDMDKMRASLNKDKYLTYFKCSKCEVLDVAVYVPWWDETNVSLFRERNCIEMSELCCSCYLKSQQ